MQAPRGAILARSIRGVIPFHFIDSLCISNLQVPVVLRFTPAQDRATIARFYMMTQTSLSGAALQYRGGPPWWASPDQGDAYVRNSSFRPQASSFQKPWPPYGGRLIANLELEFHLNHRKLSPLQIPNRKFSPLLYLFTNDQSRVTSHRFLIHGSAIKTPRNPFRNNN